MTSQNKSRNVKEKKKLSKGNSIIVSLTIIFLFGLFFWIIYYTHFSPQAKEQDRLEEIFDECIEQTAENYCNNLSKEYAYYYKSGLIQDLGLNWLSKPTQIICKDYRKIGIERYRFLDEEVDKCKEMIK